MTFTAPHYCSGGQIVSMTPGHRQGRRPGRQDRRRADRHDLPGRRRRCPASGGEELPTDDAARNALGSKRVDAWVTDRFVAKEMISKLPKAGFKIGDMLFIEQVASAVTKGNQGLADAWNKALKELIADGTIGKISQKYFQEDVTCK